MGSSTDAMWAIAPALLTSHTRYELMSMLSQQYSNPRCAEFLAVQMAAVAAGITQIGGTKNGPPFCGTKKRKKSETGGKRDPKACGAAIEALLREGCCSVRPPEPRGTGRPPEPPRCFRPAAFSY
jgi:hypothetical protein